MSTRPVRDQLGRLDVLVNNAASDRPSGRPRERAGLHGRQARAGARAGGRHEGLRRNVELAADRPRASLPRFFLATTGRQVENVLAAVGTYRSSRSDGLPPDDDGAAPGCDGAHLATCCSHGETRPPAWIRLPLRSTMGLRADTCSRTCGWCGGTSCSSSPLRTASSSRRTLQRLSDQFVATRPESPLAPGVPTMAPPRRRSYRNVQSARRSSPVPGAAGRARVRRSTGRGVGVELDRSYPSSGRFRADVLRAAALAAASCLVLLSAGDAADVVRPSPTGKRADRRHRGRWHSDAVRPRRRAGLGTCGRPIGRSTSVVVYLHGSGAPRCRSNGTRRGSTTCSSAAAPSSSPATSRARSTTPSW